MKKAIIGFLILACIISFSTVLYQTRAEELSKMAYVEKNIAREFVIPDAGALASPQLVYPIILKTAKQCNVNIFRTEVTFDKNDKAQIKKYVLLTDKTHFFDVFRLKSGRFLTAEDTQNSNFYISTKDSKVTSQVGVLKEFGGNDLVEIKSLKSSYDEFPVADDYYVEVQNDDEFNKFINTLTDNFNEVLSKEIPKQRINSENLVKNTDQGGIKDLDKGAGGVFKNYNDVILIIVLILFIYYIFNESKRIGIVKMHGISNIRIWYLLIGKLLLTMLVLSEAISLLLIAFIKDTTAQFLYKTIMNQLKIYIIITIVSLFSYVYISRIKISDTIKNYKNTFGIFIINTVLKVVCSVLAIIIGLSAFNQIMYISKNQKEMKNWEKIKDYGVFYPIGGILEPGEDYGHWEEGFIERYSKLYPILNKMGSIYICAAQYQELPPEVQKERERIEKEKNIPKLIKTITVNPNYLKQFPVMDANKKPVYVREDTTDWVVLIPYKYRYNADKIISNIQKNRKLTLQVMFEYIEKNHKNEKIPDGMIPENIQNHQNQNIEVIWTANNQKIFSFDPEVAPKAHNVIVDPIIQVMTEKNSTMYDKASASGGGLSDPMKVRLINRDALLTYKTLKPTIKELKLDDSLKQLVLPGEFYLKQIYSAEKSLNMSIMELLVILAAIIVLAVQNVIIFFSEYKYKFIVRRIFGTDFFRTYKECFLLFLATWIILLLIGYVICYFMNLNKILAFILGLFNIHIESNVPNIVVYLIIAFIPILVELLASAISLTVIENRNKVNIIKKGA